MHTKKVRFSVIYSNIVEAMRMLNPLEINKDFSTKTFFFPKGLLVLSLAVGDVIFVDVKEISASLPSDLRDFLFK